MALALQFGGEIISCDSVAVYREFERLHRQTIPKSAPRPHHADRRCSARCLVYRRRLRPPRARQRQPKSPHADVFPSSAAAPGLYLRAMLDALFDGPERDEDLRRRLRQRRRPASLWRLLRRLDSESALRIHTQR